MVRLHSPSRFSDHMLLPLVKEMITKGEGDSCAASHFLAIVHQRIKDLGIKPLLTLLRLQKAVIGIDFQTCDECCGSNRP